MLRFILRKLGYGLLVLLGVVILVFVLFQGFGDPSRLVMGQSGDAATQANIRRELYLDQPKWKQFLFYLNDISPIAVHSKEEIRTKELRGFFIGGETKLAFKLPYLRKSYQTKKAVGSILMEALPGTLMLAFAAMLLAVALGIALGAGPLQPHRRPGQGIAGVERAVAHERGQHRDVQRVGEGRQPGGGIVAAGLAANDAVARQYHRVLRCRDLLCRGLQGCRRGRRVGRAAPGQRVNRRIHRFGGHVFGQYPGG